MSLLCSLVWLQTQNPPSSGSREAEISKLYHLAQISKENFNIPEPEFKLNSSFKKCPQ